MRYGASRVHVSQQLGFTTIPAVLCLYDEYVPPGYLCYKCVHTPLEVLEAFGSPSQVGHFVVNHEMIDAHRLEP